MCTKSKPLDLVGVFHLQTKNFPINLITLLQKSSIKPSTSTVTHISPFIFRKTTKKLVGMQKISPFFNVSSTKVLYLWKVENIFLIVSNVYIRYVLTSFNSSRRVCGHFVWYLVPKINWRQYSRTYKSISDTTKCYFKRDQNKNKKFFEWKNRAMLATSNSNAILSLS